MADFNPESDSLPSPFETPGARQLAAWTLRLADHPLFGFLLSSDPHLFAMLYAACAAAYEPPVDLHGRAELVPVEGEQVAATLKDLKRQFGAETTGQFAQLYLRGFTMHEGYAKGRDTMTEAIASWRRNAELDISSHTTTQEQNLDRLASLLGMSELERDLLSFQINRDCPGFRQLYEGLLSQEHLVTQVLGIVLGHGPSAIESALAEDAVLARSGLLTIEQRPLSIGRPSQHLASMVTAQAKDDQEFFRRFCRPLRPAASTASLARLDDRDKDILMRLVSLEVPEDHGLNVLVYGPKSVDKRDMLARLMEREEIVAFELSSKQVPSSDMAAWTYVAQRFIEREAPEAVLVVDRAEQALARRSMSMMVLFGFDDDDDGTEPQTREDKASDEGLTHSRVRCLWLTDRPGMLSEKSLGRFLFHCEARPGSRGDRRERIQSVISRFGLSDDLEKHLAKYSLLGEQQVTQAATLATLVGGNDAESDRIIRRAVQQSQKALGRDRTEELRDSVTHYDLKNLNVGGRFSPEQILAALRKRPAGSLCFYGIPGAGKTQLAEYIAIELDLPIVRKSASDLLSKWLGESEQNIAAMFEEAEAEGAVLFLDEADSFLRDRALARAEWSVTQVNELLQKMERFPGIFIAATNLMRDVDAAALRRFTWKLEFLAMTNDQAWEMFVEESGYKGKEGTAKTEDLRARLAEISNLAPGDFATVKRQSLMLGEKLSAEDWVEQLKAEAKAKMLGLERNKLGFEA